MHERYAWTYVCTMTYSEGRIIRNRVIRNKSLVGKDFFNMLEKKQDSESEIPTTTKTKKKNMPLFEKQLETSQETFES